MNKLPDEDISSNNTAKTSIEQPSIRNLLIFTVIVLASGWIGIGLDISLGQSAGAGLGMLIWILSPFVVSFSLRKFGGDGWSDLGLRPNLIGNWYWYGLSIFLYPICVIVIVVLGVILGYVEWQEMNASNIKLVVVVFSQTFLLQMVQNTFEETGFRGYLTPRAYSLGWNALWVHVIVGLVWGIWQVPYLRQVLAHMVPYADENMLTLVSRFLIGTISLSLVYGELRLLTNSLWPAVLMQAIGGSFVAALVLNTILTFKTVGATIFMPMVESLLVSLLFACLGLLLYLRRTRNLIVD